MSGLRALSRGLRIGFNVAYAGFRCEPKEIPRKRVIALKERALTISRYAVLDFSRLEFWTLSASFCPSFVRRTNADNDNDNSRDSSRTDSVAPNIKGIKSQSSGAISRGDAD